MTKIIMISDSHGNRRKLENLINASNFDYIFFLGDGLSDLENLNNYNIKKVSGNCDFFSSEAITRYENLEGFKIMLTHGHDFKSKFTKSLMLENAKNNYCDIVCSGHTHKQGQEFIDGVLFINPGAFKNGQYGVLTLEKNSKPNVELFTLDSNK